MASALVGASLFCRAPNSTYFVKASVTQSINFLPLSEVFKGPNRSACTLWPGSVGWGSGDRRVGRRSIVAAPNLAMVAAFEVGCDVGVHARPVKALHQSFFHFVDAVMSGEKFAVSFDKCVRDQGGWQEENYLTGLKLTLHTAPNKSVLDKAIICKKL